LTGWSFFDLFIILVFLAVVLGLLWSIGWLLHFIFTWGRRHSPFPVSAFFLVRSKEDQSRLFQKIALLSQYGVRQQKLDHLFTFLHETLEADCLPEDIESRIPILFHLKDKEFPGDLTIRRFKQTSWEVELILPARVAYRAKKLFRNGFWTAYMPPTFYD